MRVYEKSHGSKELIITQEGSEVKIRLSKDYDHHDFELSIDEARALRDNLNRTINKYDEKPEESEERIETYDPAPMSGFFNDEPKNNWNEPATTKWEAPEEKKEYKLFKKEEEEKPKTKFYY